MNDLAWILQLRGRHEEALKMAREAIDAQSEQRDGVGYRGRGPAAHEKPEEAQEALQKALALNPTAPHMLLHMAEVYEQRGLRQEALQLAEPLTGRAAEMSPDAFEQLRRLMARLRTT